MLRAIVSSGGGGSGTPGGSTGQPQWNSLGSFAGMGAFTYATSGVNLTGQVTSNTDTAFAIKAKSGQTGNLQKWLTSAGSDGLVIDASFSLKWSGDTAISRLGAASIALGNGTAGDYTGNLKLTTLTFADGTAFSATGNHTVALVTSGTTSVTLPTSGTLATTAQLSGFLTSVNNSNWSGTQLSVANGGTGLTTLTAHSIQLGNGTSSPTQLTVPTSGTILQGVATSDPTFTATPTLGVQQTTQGSLILANTAAGAYQVTLKSSNSSTAAQTITLPPAPPASDDMAFTAKMTGVGAWTALGALATVTPGTGVATAAAVAVGSVGAVVVNGGALGTPSSGTLTSCTALPPAGVTGTAVVTADSRLSDARTPTTHASSHGVGQSDAVTVAVSQITASTSAALGVGSIELGHATDTSISRVSAGVPGVEGTPLLQAGRQTVWVPAVAMTSRTTNGPSSGSVETTTNKVMLKTLDFDATTQQYAQFAVRMPKSWNEGTITFVPVWSHPATTTNFGVVWSLAGVALSDGDAIDAAFGTVQTSTKTGGTTDTTYIGPECSAITIAGTPAAEDLVIFQISRVVADAGDTLAVNARLRGITLYITTDAATDA